MIDGQPLPAMQTMRRRFIRLGSAMIAAVVATTSLNAQDAAVDFRRNCMSCHTVGGGRLTGPDLKDVTARKDRDWLIRFITDPRALIDAGDPYAVQLMQEARNAVMPTLPGMTRSRAQSLMLLIEEESKLEKSQFVGVRVSDRPFTAADVDTGRMIFTGRLPLRNGGPACISCHAIHGLGGLGGGTIAPDLTTVFERYEGRKALTVWMSAPATPTMQSVFRNTPLEAEEILPLVAYFQQTLQRSPEDTATSRLNFVLLGLGGSLIVLGLFDVIWRGRLRSVRRLLVHSKESEKNHG